MELGTKLYNLYIKIIEKTENKSQIDNRFGCDLLEDGESYHISITSSLESFENGETIYIIQFQDLQAKISKDQYNQIIEAVKERIRYFVDIEEAQNKKRQEVIVDRLLNKFS
jgi:hypothetical protein